MSVKIYVVDTSYLIELFGCGRDSNPTASEAVRGKFKSANRAGGRFFVPLPCLFELGDHIADVSHDTERTLLVGNLIEAVRTSLSNQTPWIITPTGLPNEILFPLMERFGELATKQKIGLVDVFTVGEALRLKASFNAHTPKVHIWTNDRALKGHEPDREAHPFLW